VLSVIALIRELVGDRHFEQIYRDRSRAGNGFFIPSTWDALRDRLSWWEAVWCYRMGGEKADVARRIECRGRPLPQRGNSL